MIAKLISLFTGGAGAAVGSVVTNVAALAALTPAALWFLHNKDEIAVSFTWGQLAVMGAFVAALIKLAHYTRSPGS